MSLKLLVTTLEEVPETQRGLYTKTESGDFKLDVDGIEDSERLQKALNSERDARKEAERKAKEKDKAFSGIDVDKAREALKLQQDLEDKKLIEEGDVEGLVEKRVKQVLSERQNEHDALVGERDALKGELHELHIKTAVADAASKIGSVKPNAMGMIVGEFEKMFSIDDKGKVVAKDENGDVVYGSDGVTPLTISEKMETFVKSHDYLFVESKGGGSDGDGGKNGVSNSYSQMETTKMSGSARLNAARQLDSKQ